MAKDKDEKENGDPKRTKLPADLITKAKEMHNIRYAFTREELVQKSLMMAEAIQAKENLENEMKSMKSDFKAKIDSKDATMKLMSNHIGNGYEMRNVECEVLKDFEKGTKTYHFNGLAYDTVPLTTQDRQTELNLLNRAPASALAKHEENGNGIEEPAPSPAAQEKDED